MIFSSSETQKGMLLKIKVQDWKKMIRHLILISFLIQCTLAQPVPTGGKPSVPVPIPEAGKPSGPDPVPEPQGGKPPGPVPEGGPDPQGGKPPGPVPEGGPDPGPDPQGGKPPGPAPGPKRPWMTLHGDEPVVVSNGGFSGIFPGHTDLAYAQAAVFGALGSVVLCDLHLSRDGQGFCMGQLNIQNSTNAADVFPNRRKTYIVNGKEVAGFFALDFTGAEIYNNLSAIQSIFSRSALFDYLPPTPSDGFLANKAPVWINAEYPTFYDQHKLSLSEHIKILIQEVRKDIAYISSPEIGFLKTMGGALNGLNTRLMLKFPVDKNAVEPTTKETYAAILTKLDTIKPFAAGIVVPREYIWPVNKARYLEASTTLVADAHKAGLEVFAYGFANDNFLPYNYTYDPQKEYLQFIDNSQFAVDGLITDFTLSASMAVACIAGSKNATRKVPTLVISSNGANGDYPGSTDLAYQKAIEDGADVIDCSVQMTKDGVAFCLPKVDLMPTTTASTVYMSKAAKIPAIQNAMGIFSFDLTWDELQKLKPQMLSDFSGDLLRDPARKNVGKFVTLSDFLEMAKAKKTGVLINIENAAYLASEKGLDIIGAVTKALSNATLDKPSDQKVMIMSGQSSVLEKFKDNPTYHKVLHITKQVGFVTNETALEIKKYADTVYLHKFSIYTQFKEEGFSLNLTNLIEGMHAANVSVYVGIVQNEFIDILQDFGSDPYFLVHTLILYGADGIVTQYPGTASAYTRNLCTGDPNAYRIQDLYPGDVINFALDPNVIASYKIPPPVHLETKDFVTPPLPAVKEVAKDGGDGGSGGSAASNSTSSAPSGSPPPEGSSSSSTTAATVNAGGLFFATILGLIVSLY